MTSAKDWSPNVARSSAKTKLFLFIKVPFRVGSGRHTGVPSPFEGTLNALPPTIFYCVICSRVFAAQRERFRIDIQLKFLMSLGGISPTKPLAPKLKVAPGESKTWP